MGRDASGSRPKKAKTAATTRRMPPVSRYLLTLTFSFLGSPAGMPRPTQHKCAEGLVRAVGAQLLALWLIPGTSDRDSTPHPGTVSSLRRPRILDRGGLARSCP